jgi:hypothetical protein
MYATTHLLGLQVKKKWRQLTGTHLVPERVMEEPRDRQILQYVFGYLKCKPLNINLLI